MFGRLRSLSPQAIDLALAGALTAYAQIDVWVRGLVPGEEVPAALALAAMTAPLAFRRRWPLGAAALSMGALAVEALVAHGRPQGGALLFPILLVLYTVSAHAELSRALAGAGLAVAAALLQSTQDPTIVRVGDLVLVDVFFLGLIGGGVWLAGRYVRRRRGDVARLEGSAALAKREREERARRAVAAERARIARELHDVIAHTVSVMGVQAAAAAQVLSSNPERARPPLESIQETARDAVAELHRLLGVLREGSEPTGLAPQPGLEALDALIVQARDTGLDLELQIEGDPQPLSPGIELTAYRIIQEALTNARKHAPGASVRVTIAYRSDAVSLFVADDGPGPSRNGDGTGNGIIGMRERTALYGGRLQTGPRREGGFFVRASLPRNVRGP
jgi:signal transduction histidine kinase